MKPDDLRRAWIARVMESPGMEILAVQTLRNSIMAATVMASTSALGLMGLLSLGHLRRVAIVNVEPMPSQLLMLLPLALLALCVVEFSQSVRLYHRSYRQPVSMLCTVRPGTSCSQPGTDSAGPTR